MPYNTVDSKAPSELLYVADKPHTMSGYPIAGSIPRNGNIPISSFSGTGSAGLPNTVLSILKADSWVKLLVVVPGASVLPST